MDIHEAKRSLNELKSKRESELKSLRQSASHDSDDMSRFVTHIENEFNRGVAVLAADPDVLPHLRMWRIEAHGIYKYRSIQYLIRSVCENMEKYGVILENNDNRVSCQCTTEEADKLCSELYRKFESSIGSGELELLRYRCEPVWKD